MEGQQVDKIPVASPAAAAQDSTAEAQVSTEPAHISGGAAAQVSGEVVKKKMGRPRKYGPDGSVVYHRHVAALSPMPISASIPLNGDFPAWNSSRGEQGAFSFEEGLTPHVITVNAGEDVNMKVISFSQLQGSRAICILSANGSVSNVTLSQPSSSGGTLTYEGRFEILSLTGSFTPTDIGGTKSRSGGMSVSLAGPDGRVYGGGLAGLLTAATPVQVVIGSFLPGHHQEQKPKKPKFEQNTTIYSPSPLNHHSGEAIGGSYGVHNHHTVIPNSIHVSNNLSSENVIHFGRSDSNDNNESPKFDFSS